MNQRIDTTSRSRRARHPILAKAKRVIRARRYRGDQFECPICGGRFRAMLPTPSGRPEATCPNCRSSERHRALWLYLKRETDLFTADHRVLHFAPEDCLTGRLRRSPNLTYTTVDLYDSKVDVQADITKLPFDDNSADFILCNHVLEHIVADDAAIRELARVLKPGGRAVMQHPVDMDRATTFEDSSVTTPEERDRLFYQFDHVRIYGRDFEDRLRAGGFVVVDEGLYEDRLTPEERTRYRVEQLPSARPERDIEASRIWVGIPKQ